jgi:membrane-bound inhibitor of C-type lysozyme
MNDPEPTIPDDVPDARPSSNSIPEPSAADHPESTAIPSEPGRLGPRRPLLRRRGLWIAVVAVACSILGVTVGLATTSSAAPPSQSTTAARPASGGAPVSATAPGSGSNARSGPASGGAAGTVRSVSISSFTMTTSGAQDVTVDDSSSTAYKKGNSSTSATAITKGETVLVLGITDNTTIDATQVIMESGDASANSSTTKVVPFQRGTQTTSKQVGQIPANWSEGSGTVVGGTAANQATEAALAAYPGGIVDRVVLLSDGDYNVHYIGVNWPHHVFLNQDFKVIGAE